MLVKQLKESGILPVRIELLVKEEGARWRKCQILFDFMMKSPPSSIPVLCRSLKQIKEKDLASAIKRGDESSKTWRSKLLFG